MQILYIRNGAVAKCDFSKIVMLCHESRFSSLVIQIAKKYPICNKPFLCQKYENPIKTCPRKNAWNRLILNGPEKNFQKNVNFSAAKKGDKKCSFRQWLLRRFFMRGGDKCERVFCEFYLGFVQEVESEE